MFLGNSVFLWNVCAFLACFLIVGCLAWFCIICLQLFWGGHISLPFLELQSMWSVFFICHWRMLHTLPSFHFFVACCCDVLCFSPGLSDFLALGVLLLPVLAVPADFLHTTTTGSKKSKKPNKPRKPPKATQTGEARKHTPTQQTQKQKNDWEYVNCM